MISNEMIVNPYAVNRTNLAENLNMLEKIGTIEGIAGVNRIAYTLPESHAHDYLRQKMEEEGLATRVDGAGNLYGTLPGRSLTQKLVVGSHLDSVPQGGNYDGALGVVMGLEALRVLKMFRPHHTLELVAFRAEESSRFKTSCIGSKFATGALTVEQSKGIKDTEGISIYDAIRECGYNPEAIEVWNREENTFYLEAHIEQGSVLADTKHAAGIVNGIRAPVLRELHRIENTHKVAVRLDKLERLDPIELLEEHYAPLQEAFYKLLVPVTVLPSGAGHDASHISSRGIPTAMLFVRNTGGSHNPAESITLEDAVTGTNLMIQTLLEVDRQ